MADYRIFVCHNVITGETFTVEKVQDVAEMYRKDFYHYKLYLKYNPQENNEENEEVIIEACYQEIIEKINTNNLWEEETGLYIMDFKTTRSETNGEDVSNNSIKSLESDFEIDWNENIDDEDFFSDDSGYQTPSASSTIILNEGDSNLDLSVFSDDQDF